MVSKVNPEIGPPGMVAQQRLKFPRGRAPCGRNGTNLHSGRADGSRSRRHIRSTGNGMKRYVHPPDGHLIVASLWPQALQRVLRRSLSLGN